MRPSKQWQGGLTGRLTRGGHSIDRRQRGEGVTEGTRKGRGSKHNCSAIMLPICSSHLEGGGGGGEGGGGRLVLHFPSGEGSSTFFMPWATQFWE